MFIGRVLLTHTPLWRGRQRKIPREAAEWAASDIFYCLNISPTYFIPLIYQTDRALSRPFFWDFHFVLLYTTLPSTSRLDRALPLGLGTWLLENASSDLQHWFGKISQFPFRKISRLSSCTQSFPAIYLKPKISRKSNCWESIMRVREDDI